MIRNSVPGAQVARRRQNAHVRRFTLLLIALLHRLDRALAISYFESLAVRRQRAVLNRKTPRPRLHPSDRWFWVPISSFWPDWRDALAIVKPATVIGWTEARSRLKQAAPPRPVSSRSTAPAKRILNALRLRPAAEKFKKCNGFGFSGTTTGRSCCVSHRAVGLFRACCRPVIVVFLTCFPRVPDSASEAVKPLNHHKKSTTSGPERPKIHQKTAITRDFRLKAETSSLETACTASKSLL